MSRKYSHEIKIPCLCGVTCVTYLDMHEPGYVKSLEAENTRLRKTLDKIAAWGLPQDMYEDYTDKWSMNVARSALENE